MAKYTLESDRFETPIAVEAEQFAALVEENKRLTVEIGQLTKERDALYTALNPLVWTDEQRAAWYAAIPDLQAAFDGLRIGAIKRDVGQEILDGIKELKGTTKDTP